MYKSVHSLKRRLLRICKVCVASCEMLGTQWWAVGQGWGSSPSCFQSSQVNEGFSKSTGDSNRTSSVWGGDTEEGLLTCERRLAEGGFLEEVQHGDNSIGRVYNEIWEACWATKQGVWRQEAAIQEDAGFRQISCSAVTVPAAQDGAQEASPRTASPYLRKILSITLGFSNATQLFPYINNLVDLTKL